MSSEELNNHPGEQGKRPKRRQKSAYIRAALLIAVAALFVLWGYIFIRPRRGYEEVIVETGCGGAAEFTAASDYIWAIIPNNEDAALNDYLEENQIAIQVTIEDMEGNVAGKAWSDATSVHTCGYISHESCYLEGLPIHLERGHQYRLKYEAVCNDIGLPNLSFALYGPEHSWNRFFCLFSGVSLILTAAAGLLLMSGGRNGYHVVWLCLLLLYIPSLPLYISEQREADAFADAYRYASEMSAGDASGQQGVAVRESGIRNLAYLSYDIPLYRFWTDFTYGYVQTEGMTSTLFHDTGRLPDPDTLLRAAAIATAQRLSLPYQAVFLAGSLVPAVVFLMLLLLALHLSAGVCGLTQAVLVIGTLPSVIRSALQYSGKPLLVSLLILAFVCVLRKRRIRGTAPEGNKDTAAKGEGGAGWKLIVMAALLALCWGLPFGLNMLRYTSAPAIRVHDPIFAVSDLISRLLLYRTDRTDHILILLMGLLYCLYRSLRNLCLRKSQPSDGPEEVQDTVDTEAAVMAVLLSAMEACVIFTQM